MIPISIAPDWNLIVRTIVPIVGREDVSPLDTSEWGFGNTLQSFFFSPKAPTAGGLIWGIGPAFNYPTTTDPLFGPSEWGAGPTAVALLQKGKWTTGVLANQIWSFENTNQPGGINAFFIQPFVNYSLGNGLTLNANIQASYDWIGEQWTAPLNAGFSKVFTVGTQPMSFALNGTYYIARPDAGPRWGVQPASPSCSPPARNDDHCSASEAEVSATEPDCDTFRVAGDPASVQLVRSIAPETHLRMRARP